MPDDWFDRFVAEHWLLHGRSGVLPPQNSEQFGVVCNALFESLADRGIAYRDAAAASRRLLCESLPHSSHHFPRLVELAVEIGRARSALASGLDPSSFEAVKLATAELRDGQGCEWCGGDGTLSVYSPNPDRPASVAAHCVCPAGRWVRSKTMARDAATCRKIVDAADVLAGRSGWLLSPPGVLAGEERFAAVERPTALLRSLVNAHRMTRVAERAERRNTAIGAAEIAFAQGLPEAEKERFLALDVRERDLVMRGDDPILAPKAAALLGREPMAVAVAEPGEDESPEPETPE